MALGHQAPQQVAVLHLLCGQQKGRLSLLAQLLHHRKGVLPRLALHQQMDLLPAIPRIRGLIFLLIRGIFALLLLIGLIPPAHLAGSSVNKIPVRQDGAAAADPNQRGNAGLTLVTDTPAQTEKAADGSHWQKYISALINGMGLVIIPVFVVGGLIGHVKAKIRAGRIQHGKACAAVIHIGYAQIRFVKQLAGYIQHPAGIEGHGLTVKIHQLLIGGSKIYAFQHRPAFFRHQHRYQGQSQQPCPDSAGQSFPHSQPPPFFSPSGMIVHFSTKDSAAQRKLHSQPQRLSLFLFQYGMI